MNLFSQMCLMLFKYASWYNNDAVVEVFLEFGADVGAININRSSPLHYAAGQGHVQVTRLLLRRGADATAKDIDGILYCLVLNDLVSPISPQA